MQRVRDTASGGSDVLPQLRYEDERSKLLPQLWTEAGIRGKKDRTGTEPVRDILSDVEEG